MLALFNACVGNHTSAEEVYKKLEEKYNEMGHPYHNWDHVEIVVQMLAPYVIGNRCAFLAALYHDCVYEPGSKTNEEESAEFAETELQKLGVPVADRQKIRDYILATKHTDNLTDPIAMYVADADLAGLGFSSEIYKKNTLAIRSEFSKFSDDQWKAGRIEFITALLAKPKLYYTDEFRRLFEDTARTNLQNELDSLL